MTLKRQGSAVILLLMALESAGQEHKVDLTEKSLEDLMNVEITSAAKKEQRLSQTPSAIFVLTQEDIRRSGAASIPEALRGVPGIQVARVDASKWAISARGFNDRFANKMLVLIDGRSVYAPIFSGVFWDLQDTLIEDVSRIEVIRGPGATVWGANAVNGVINIITKKAQDTQGGLVTATAGSGDGRGSGAIRYGAKAGEKGFYRVYGKYLNHDEEAGVNIKKNAADDWDAARGGFRWDTSLSSRDSLTVQGDLYRERLEQRTSYPDSRPPFFPVALDTHSSMAGGNVLALWKHHLADNSQISLQAYYDRTTVDLTEVGESRDTIDLDFQHRLGIGSRQDLTWGAGLRTSKDAVRNTFEVSLFPLERRDNLYSAYVQDEIALVRNHLWLTAGIKTEHNAYTGFGVQPGVRILWEPHKRHSLWAAVSRALRNPSRVESDGLLHISSIPNPTGLSALVTIHGDPNLADEKMRGHELGYRLQPHTRVSLDFAAFYNRYHDLQSQDTLSPSLVTGASGPYLEIPFLISRRSSGETHGLEAAANWTVSKRWKLSGSYSWLRANTGGNPPGDGNAPRHQLAWISSLHLPAHLEFDTSLYYVSRLDNLQIPVYTKLDTHLTWRAGENWELNAGGRDLLSPQRLEFVAQVTSPAAVRRGYYVRFERRF